MRWEYRVDSPPALFTLHVLEEWLNEMGRAGWELVVSNGSHFIFKRVID